MKKYISLSVALYVMVGMIMGLAVVARPGISATLKFNPIKPSMVAVTDEQQGILAVRSAKAAVVSIVGSQSQPDLNNAELDTIFGSGFVVSSDGYIATNSHVVQTTGASYQVIFLDGKKLPARVVGLDKYDDIALLKVEAQGLATVKLGNSESLETGQTVFAIGDALGKYQNTVTKGVVSGLGRAVSLGTPSSPKPRYQNLIQTDAAISQGNSGGPLINMAGEVVGMNTLVEQGGQGLGFAIPVSLVKSVVDQLKSGGKVSRAYLGINFQTIDKRTRAIKTLPVPEGALVVTITPGSAAQLAGIAIDDIVVSVEKENVTERNELDKVLLKYNAGQQVFLGIIRNGERIDLPVVLGEYK